MPEAVLILSGRGRGRRQLLRMYRHSIMQMIQDRSQASQSGNANSLQELCQANQSWLEEAIPVTAELLLNRFPCILA